MITQTLQKARVALWKHTNTSDFMWLPEDPTWTVKRFPFEKFHLTQLLIKHSTPKTLLPVGPSY